FRIIGDSEPVRAAQELLKSLYDLTATQQLTPEQVHLSLQQSGLEALLESASTDSAGQPVPEIHTRRGPIRGRGPAQIRYLKNIRESDLTFGIGPAGTGKTYLAVASAVQRSEDHTSELQSRENLVCRLLLEKKK